MLSTPLNKDKIEPKYERILITGGSGFLGHSVLKNIITLPESQNSQIFVTVNQSELSLKDPKIIPIHCNLLNIEQTKTVILKIRPTLIIHCAWNMEHQVCKTAPENIEWVIATLNLAKIFQEIQGKKFIFIGSIYECFGSKTIHSEIIEKTLYGVSKRHAYEILKSFFETRNIIFQHVIPAFITGPQEQKGKLITSTIEKITQNLPVTCTNPNFEIDFIHVEDVAKIIYTLAFQNEKPLTINASSGKKTRLFDVIKLICKEMNYPTQKVLKTNLKKRSAYLKNNLEEVPYRLKHTILESIQEIKKNQYTRNPNK